MDGKVLICHVRAYLVVTALSQGVPADSAVGPLSGALTLQLERELARQVRLSRQDYWRARARKSLL